MTQEISFWKYLEIYDIVIPIIQRDYAQGRQKMEILRCSFLTNLKQALDGHLPGKEEVLKLDFIYGAYERGKMNPLDGQQRLTTLWLLHWYVAYRADKLTEEVKKRLSKFTYETRMSSTEFCFDLVNKPIYHAVDDNSISSAIQKQTWFYSVWKQDPTIQSMLRMLNGTDVKDKDENDIIDGLCELFSETSKEEFEVYWERLISDKCPIRFYHLPMNEFQLTDELYIKMNARGKQLTSFENFKADLVGYIREHEWEDLLDAKEGLMIKMDNAWTDIFWKNKSLSNRIDEIYFAFINRFFLNYHIRNISDENDQLYVYLTNKGQDGDNGIQYETLEKYKSKGQIPKELFENLMHVLDNYSSSWITKEDLICPWEKDFRFIPEYETINGEDVFYDKDKKTLKVTTVNQVERVVFYAVCKYFTEGICEEGGKENLKRWMRFVWNIVSVQTSDGNSAIRSVSEMKNVIKLIDTFESHNIYNSLIDFCGEIPDSAIGRQLQEEIYKAQIILSEDGVLAEYDGKLKRPNGRDYSTWEDIICEAEKYAFFTGCIRFLFRKGGSENLEWDKKDFDIKWSKAQDYFDENGIKDTDETKYKSECCLLKSVLNKANDFWRLIEPNKVVLDNTANTWRNRILISRSWSDAVHSILMGDLSINVREEDPLLYKALYNTNLICYIANNQEGSRIRWIHGHRSIYPPRYEGMIPDDDTNNFYRNRILSSCYNQGLIKSDKKISNCDYFRGWNVEFTYTKDDIEYNFIYFTNNTVCLVESEGNQKKKKNDDLPDTPENTYYFPVNGDMSVQVFCDNLENLIVESQETL